METVKFLSSADLLTFLDQNGQIAEQGSFEDLRRTSPNVQDLLEKHTGASSLAQEEEIEEAQTADVAKSAAKDKVAEEQEDQRRQLGDRTVYRYYFGAIGKTFLVTLLVLEITWAFLESFPSSS